MASVQSHIHLQSIDDRPWTVDGVPDNTYRIIHESMGLEPRAWIHTDIALDGTPHIHQLCDEGGEVIQRDYYSSRYLVTAAQFAALVQEVGKIVDYVPPIHPNPGGDASDYITMMLVVKMRVEEVDSMLQYYRVSVDLEPVGEPEEEPE